MRPAAADGGRGQPRGEAKPQVFLRGERDASGRTFLARKFATYPFFCAAPFYLDRAPRGMPTVILQSMSGGLYEHDRLAVAIEAAAGAEIHVTTQGATVAHGMPHGGEAQQEVRISASAGSFVEYLPDPLILMPGAGVRACVDVVAEPGSTVALGDAFLMHDPEGRGQAFRSLASETVVRRPDGRLLCAERFAISGDEAADAWRSLRSDSGALGALWICSPHPTSRLVDAMRAGLAGWPSVFAGASELPGGSGACARILAPDAAALGDAFRAAWRAVRREVTGEDPPARRKSGWL